MIELLGHASDMALRDEDTAAARALMAEAADRSKAWHAAQPEDTVRQITLVLIAINAGTMHLTLKEHDQAMAVWTAALPVARTANGKAGPMARRMLALLLLRLCDTCVRCDRLPEAREWFARAIAETAVQRSEMARYDPLPELFDRADFKDLLPPATGDK